MATYHLSVTDRFAILNALPAKGNVDALAIIESIRNKLRPSPEELQALGAVTMTDGSTQWDETLDTRQPFELNDLESEKIKSELSKLEQSSELHLSQLHAFRVFHNGKLSE